MKLNFSLELLELLVLLSVFAYFPNVTSLTEAQIDFLEGMITSKFLPDHSVPGMAVSVVHGEQTYASGFGLSNIEESILSSNDTLFGVGSLSKMISSLFITKLLNDKFPQHGENVLDIPIRQLAPSYNLVFSDRYRTEYTTFRDLLSHKMCLSSFVTEIVGGVGAFRNKSDVVYRQRYAPQDCHFRNIQMSYNNVMIHVAAEAAAAAVNGDGTPFDDLLTAFLRQIGMNRTRLIREDEDFEQIPNMSQPYYRRDGVTRPFNIDLLRRAAYISASGGVLTTATDMLAYMSLILNKGKVGDTQVVKEEIINWITRISTPYRFNSYKNSPTDRPVADIGYGIGLILGIHDNWQKLQHSGWIPPYTALITLFPAHKYGMFTVANGPNGNPNHYHLHHQMFESILGNVIRVEDYISTPATAEDYFPETGMFPEPEADAQDEYDEFNSIGEITVQLNHSDLVGSYGLPLVGSFNITNINETTLYFEYGQWLVGYLLVREEAPAIYDFLVDTDLPHHFYASNQNMPEAYVDFSTADVAKLRYSGQTFSFFKDFDMDSLPDVPWDESSCGP